jgi:hypothetical protein
LDRISYWRYIINIFVVGLPVFFLACISVAYNIFFNIDFNLWWAEGNAWLIGNTVWLILTAIHSTMLAFEIPFYMRMFKIGRYFGCFNAAVYNVIYFGLTFGWISELYIQDDSKASSADMFINMMLGYNIVMHAPIIPLNVFIIVKEITLQFFSFLHGGVGTAFYKENIDETTTGAAWSDVLWIINPVTYINWVQSWFTHFAKIIPEDNFIG